MIRKYSSLLSDNPLCGIDTDKDTLNLSTGLVTRTIKKRVITNEDTFTKGGSGDSAYFVINLGDSSGAELVCSHFVYTSIIASTTDVGASITSSSANLRIRPSDVENTTADQFNQWISEQYLAGTPVIIWYVLATPTTETITVPIGLSGTEEGYLNQSGIPTPTNPIYPIGNTVGYWTDIPYYIRKTATDNITSLPTTIYGDGTNATVAVNGQSSQTSTPSPSSPVPVSGVGEMSVNLTNVNNFTNSEVTDTGRDYFRAQLRLSDSTNVAQAVKSNGHYKLSIENVGNTTVTFRHSGVTTNILIFNYTATFSTPHTVTVSFDVEGYDPENLNGLVLRNIMLNVGSDELPYAPYGQYIIPILSGGVTTNVYLGEVQSTRQIEKIKLDELTWTYTSTTSYSGFYIYDYTVDLIEAAGGYCNKLGIFTGSFSAAPNNSIIIYESSGRQRLFIRYDDAQGDVTALKTMLEDAILYAVKTAPTTAVVNEPLRKIGDYADSVSVTGIPTTATPEQFDINTVLKPSEVQLAYHGWHEHSDKIFPSPEWKANSWSDYQEIVRSGKAPDLYPVGTILYDDWGNDQSTAFEIVGYDKHFDSDLTAQGYTHSATLQELKLDIRQFDAIEAWLYAETAIPTGTYRFKIPNYDTSYGGNKWYYFTSTANVPVGGQLTLTWAYDTNPTKVQAYSSSTSTSPLFNVDITEWIEGTSPDAVNLGVIKLAQSDDESDYGKLNHIHRARYGSNNYWQSGLRQLLNSSSVANAWWQPTTVFDRPYGNRNIAGYLTTLNSSFKDILATPDITDVANNLFESTGLDGKSFTLNTEYAIKDKIFILSHTEVNLSSNPNVGSVIDYYVNAGNDKRLKYRKDNENVYYWWLRLPHPSYAHGVRNVNTSGGLSSYYASFSIGVAAACVIQ